MGFVGAEGERGDADAVAANAPTAFCAMGIIRRKAEEAWDWTKSRLLEAFFCLYERSFEKKGKNS